MKKKFEETLATGKELSIHYARYVGFVHLLRKPGNLRQMSKHLGHNSLARRLVYVYGG